MNEKITTLTEVLHWLEADFISICKPIRMNQYINQSFYKMFKHFRAGKKELLAYQIDEIKRRIQAEKDDLCFKEYIKSTSTTKCPSEKPIEDTSNEKCVNCKQSGILHKGICFDCAHDPAITETKTFSTAVSIENETKTVDNFEKILPFIQTKESGKTHLIQFINRNKNNDSRTSSLKDLIYKEKLIARWEEYKKIAEVTGCRIYINLNYYDNKAILLSVAKRVIEHYETYTGGHVLNSVFSEIGKSCESKMYLADVDNMLVADSVRTAIGSNIITELPSVSGLHFIFKPYDYRNLNGLASVHKNNPTILYYKGTK